MRGGKRGRSVYLSGPISGLKYGGATDWRKKAAMWFQRFGIDAYSPMRNKQDLDDGSVLRGDPAAYVSHGLANPSGIVTRDRFDTTRCDVMLLNLLPAEDTGKISIGSMIEVGWADALRVPVVTVMRADDNPHNHAMLIELSGYVFDNLYDGMQMVKHILLP